MKRAIAQLAAAEGRLLSIRDELFGRAWQLGKLLPAIKDRVGHGKWMIWLPDGNSGRGARLRIAKPSISEPCFSLQFVTRFTRGKQVFRVKSSQSRMASRSTLVLAQILAHRRARPLTNRVRPALRLVLRSELLDSAVLFVSSIPRVLHGFASSELFLQRFLVLAAESGYSRAAKLGDCLSAR